MIHPDDALNTIINSAVVLGCETIKVINSNGRILYNDIYSNIDLPGFNKSAMDGYAYNSKDNLTEYELVEVIPAGHIPEIKLKKGQCSKIMTGAMLPEGADRVIRVE
ncbi:MAG: molybdopterin molybdenumtransferase MoeA, partial [Cyanobacteriota bacterium]